MKEGFLFHNVKYCKICQHPLPMDYALDVCPLCEEYELFSKVKDYIRENEVTEYQVADEFKIPLRKVKAWIKEGRIEYKEVDNQSIHKLHCLSCGQPITFGSYCQKCYKLMNTPKATAVWQEEDSKMRFFDTDT